MPRSPLFPLLACAAALLAAPAAADTLVDPAAERISQAAPLPLFKADTAWPRLPGDLMLGQVSGVAVALDDRIWVLTRPDSLGPTDVGLEADPPQALACCRRPGHLLRFDQDGHLIGEFDGAATAPVIDGVSQWPQTVHGLHVDDRGALWIGGNGDGDHVVVNYSPDGQFLRQIGRRGRTAGNLSPDSLGNPTDANADGDVVLVSDGYINKRVIAFDAADLSFDSLWGAYGRPPDAPVREGAFDQSQATSTGDGGPDPQSASFGDIVHCVVRGPDATVYVCDRRNNRLQLFRETAQGLAFLRDITIGDGTGGTRTVTDVGFSPDGTHVYVADMMNGRVWILLRETHEVLGWFGRNGRYPGEFIWLHSLDVDSHGNIHTGEVSTGRRVQRFVFTGFAE